MCDDHEHTSKFPFVETELMWFAYDSGFICNELVKIVGEFSFLTLKLTYIFPQQMKC